MERKVSIFGQTIVEGGAVLQALQGNFSDDADDENQNLVVVRAMSIEVLGFLDSKLSVCSTISVNKAIDQCCVLKCAGTAYKRDLLFIVSYQMDGLILQFYGQNNALHYQVLSEFSLLDYLRQDSTFRLPFQKKTQPTIHCLDLGQVKLLALAYQESQSMLGQLCFVAVKCGQNIEANIGLVKQYPGQNPSGLITNICVHEPLQRVYKGRKMLPQLGLFAMYLNKYFTYDPESSSLMEHFDGIRYLSDGVRLSEGPFQLTNVADFAQVLPLPNSDAFMFPLLVASIDRLQVVYNLTEKIEFVFKDHLDAVRLTPMSRPLGLSEKNGLILASYDDGRILSIQVDFAKRELNVQTVPKLCRMPTATSVVQLNCRTSGKDHVRLLTYLGSQSTDSVVMEISQGQAGRTFSVLQDRFQQCIGAVQDFCLLSHNRVFISTSHGRDGSLIAGRFGFQFRAFAQQQIGFKGLQTRRIDTRRINSLEFFPEAAPGYQIIVVSDTESKGSHAFRFTDDQKLEPIHDERLEKETWLRLFTFENKAFEATEEWIEYQGQRFSIPSKQIFRIKDHVLVLTKADQLFFFKMGEKLTRVAVHDVPGALAVCANVVGDEVIVIITDDRYTVHLFGMRLGKLTELSRIQTCLRITSVSCLIDAGESLVIAGAADESIYVQTVPLPQLQTGEIPSDFKAIFSRQYSCQLQQYRNHIFVKSWKSLNKLEMRGGRAYMLPINTDPFSNIIASSAIPCIIPMETQECQNPSLRQQLIRYPIPAAGMGKEENIVRFAVAVITDGMVKTATGPAVQYDIAYEEEGAPIAQENYLVIARPDLVPKYSMRRYLVKRTPIKTAHCPTLTMLAVLTEQHVGRCQIRFYSDDTAKEFAKLLPEKCVVTDIQFVTIKGRIYFAFSKFQVQDLYLQICDPRSEELPGAPQLVLHNTEDFALTQALEFPCAYPITSCLQSSCTQELVCCVGQEIYILAPDLPLRIVRKVELPSIIDHLVETRCGYVGVRTGQLFWLDANFEEQTLNAAADGPGAGHLGGLPDIKLLSKMGDLLAVVTNDNVVGIFSAETRTLVARLPMNQNTTCLKEMGGKLYLGTDTGAIVVLCTDAVLFLEALQAEIINQFETIQQKLYLNPDLLNAVDGDVIKLYYHMALTDQEAIASRVHSGRQLILDTLIELGMKLAE